VKSKKTFLLHNNDASPSHNLKLNPRSLEKINTVTSLIGGWTASVVFAGWLTFFRLIPPLSCHTSSPYLFTPYLLTTQQIRHLFSFTFEFPFVSHGRESIWSN
jgi:hypothetical protein